VPEAPLVGLSQRRLERMLEAGLRVEAISAELSGRRSNAVLEALGHVDVMIAEQHYPPRDISDPQSHAQLFYHAHRNSPEHGHFHTFIRRDGIPLGQRALRRAGSEGGAHLIAVSMNAAGDPIELFTVNQWVTGEDWHGARTVVGLIDNFRFADGPHAALTRWLSELLILFRPEIEELVDLRDQAIAKLRRERPGSDPLADRAIEVLSNRAVSVERQIRRVRRAMTAKG